jgi:polysaccharide export outer membrane protein
MRAAMRIGVSAAAAAALLFAGTGCARLRGKLTPAMPPDDALTPQLGASAAGLSTDRSPPAPQPLPPAPEANPAPPPVAPDSVRRAMEIAPNHAAYRIRSGDPLIIYLRGIMPRDEDFQLIVNERGDVVLPFIGDVRAAGRTSSELEREIQRTYIEREIYRAVTVNVIVPSQSFFVQGEVRAPQRYPIIAGMTLMQAIAAAGGYTEFADRRRVMLTRAGVVRTINMRDIERDPRLDITIESGDVIRVPRSIF